MLTLSPQVPDHKTTKTFGRAKLTVTKDFWQRLKRFLGLRPKLPGYQFQPSTVFFSATGKELNTMGRCVTAAWKLLGLSGILI